MFACFQPYMAMKYQLLPLTFVVNQKMKVFKRPRRNSGREKVNATVECRSSCFWSVYLSGAWVAIWWRRVATPPLRSSSLFLWQRCVCVCVCACVYVTSTHLHTPYWTCVNTLLLPALWPRTLYCLFVVRKYVFIWVAPLEGTAYNICSLSLTMHDVYKHL